ncbi:addiction module protein [Lysobacter alkalisoli]|uniref:Addiction module protein n=2 Tax=Marilutibacter alkalisoli TaxID=2591633 RepID=A0A514BUB9_9GAMM|nr:addiction module protein [Lysobacter alkalisoli]
MSTAEKLRAMEELWESLSSEEGGALASPEWHEDALRETEARHAAGGEHPLDWVAAKRELRKPRR